MQLQKYAVADKGKGSKIWKICRHHIYMAFYSLNRGALNNVKFKVASSIYNNLKISSPYPSCQHFHATSLTNLHYFVCFFLLCPSSSADVINGSSPMCWYCCRLHTKSINFPSVFLFWLYFNLFSPDWIAFQYPKERSNSPCRKFQYEKFKKKMVQQGADNMDQDHLKKWQPVDLRV